MRRIFSPYVIGTLAGFWSLYGPDPPYFGFIILAVTGIYYFFFEYLEPRLENPQRDKSIFDPLFDSIGNVFVAVFSLLFSLGGFSSIFSSDPPHSLADTIICYCVGIYFGWGGIFLLNQGWRTMDRKGDEGR